MNLFKPDPEERVRGTCPRCGEPVVSEMRYTVGQGYVIVWSCLDVQACRYWRVL